MGAKAGTGSDGLNKNKRGNNMGKKEDGDMGLMDRAVEPGLPAFITRPNRKQRKAATRTQPKAEDDTHAMAAEMNVTSAGGLKGKALERMIKLQRSTGITEEVRLKLDAVEGLRIGYAEQNRPRAQNVCQVPIEYYRKRGWISQRQFDAGEEFYRLWYYGAQRARYGVSRDPRMPRGKPNHDLNEVMRDKYEKAKKSIHGLAQALVCYNVCCIGEWASKLWPKQVLVEEGMQVDSADDLRPLYADRDRKMEWLKQALDDLAGHFRIPTGRDVGGLHQ